MRGANPEQLDALAVRFEQSADRLDVSLREISHLVLGADWHGHDFDEFSHSFRGDVSMRIGRHAALLRSQAATLRSQAAEQRRASEEGFGFTQGAAAGAAVGAAGAGAAVHPEHGSSRGKLANHVERLGENHAALGAPAGSMAGYMEKLTTLPDGTLQIVRIDGEPPRYVVLMKGIDGFEPQKVDSPYRTDLAGATFEKFGSGGPWGDAVKTALADAMKGDIAAGKTPEVMLMGHSGGGIVAANLAADPSFNSALGGKYHLTDVVIAGSGVVEKLNQIPGQTNVLMLHHSTDLVANAIQNPDTAVGVLQGNLGKAVIGEAGGLTISTEAALTPTGSHQVDVFNSVLRWDRGAEFGGVTGHDQIYYTDELKHLSATKNSLVTGMEQRYSSGTTGHSYFYRLHD